MNPLGLPGYRIIESAEVPAEKSVVWRTERKWSHRLMFNRNQRFKSHSKKVPCYDCVVHESSKTIFCPVGMAGKLRSACL